MKKNSIKRLVFASMLLFGVAAIYLFLFYNGIKQKEEEAKQYAIAQESTLLKRTLERAIDDKQKALNAIALALLFDGNITKRVKQKRIPAEYAGEFSRQLRRFSNYKNIWMQLYDKDGSVLYRSWVKELEEIETGENPQSYFEYQTLVNYIDVDPYDLCINSLVKLEDEAGEYVGALDLKAHFNSISKELANYEADSVVVVKKGFRSILFSPFTNTFLGEYYIANLDASKENLDYLQTHGIKRFMHAGYMLDSSKLILSYPLKNLRGETVAYYIVFKDIGSIISRFKMESFIEWMQIAFVTLFLVILAIFTYEAYLGREQQRYYRSIIDNSRNIIIITDGQEIVDVNKSFLELFGVESLEAFKAKNERCLHDYFLKEDGYLDLDKIGESWFEYVLQNPQKKHKVKMRVNGEIRYFMVNVSRVDIDETLYSIVMADITAEEKYRLELEKTAISDPLTGIYNRRFFQEKLKEEILLAQRYGRSFSLILMDIDHFKKINDRYGHDMGDKVLVEFASLALKERRETDILCRVGGEEFALILPETTLNDAVRVAKKINHAVRENPDVTVPITVSVGVVEYIKGESEEDIFKRADNALYKAKTSGRDRVVIG